MKIKQRILIKIKELNAAIAHYDNVDVTKLSEFKTKKLALEEKFSEGIGPDQADLDFIQELNEEENTLLRNRLTLECELDGLKQTMMLDLVEITKKFIVTTERTLINPKGFTPDERVYVRPAVFFQFDKIPKASDIPEGLPIDYSKLVVLNSEHIVSGHKLK